jgi:hypothetical protein
MDEGEIEVEIEIELSSLLNLNLYLNLFIYFLTTVFKIPDLIVNNLKSEVVL